MQQASQFFYSIWSRRAPLTTQEACFSKDVVPASAVMGAQHSSIATADIDSIPPMAGYLIGSGQKEGSGEEFGRCHRRRARVGPTTPDPSKSVVGTGAIADVSATAGCAVQVSQGRSASRKVLGSLDADRSYDRNRVELCEWRQGGGSRGTNAMKWRAADPTPKQGRSCPRTEVFGRLFSLTRGRR